MSERFPVNGDVRVEAGLAAQRILLADRIAAGAEQVGWKIGFGSPSGLALLDLGAPLMGHLLSSGNSTSDGPGDVVHVLVDDWTAPVIEAEIAAWIGTDIPPDTDPAIIDRFLAGLGPAIELADLDHAPSDPERIVAGNIFQRAFALGSSDPNLTIEQVSTLTARFRHNDEVLEITDPPALIGDIRQVLAHAARTAPSLGRGLMAGDVILLGSIIAPRKVAPGDHCSFSLGEYPEMQIAF